MSSRIPFPTSSHSSPSAGSSSLSPSTSTANPINHAFYNTTPNNTKQYSEAIADGAGMSTSGRMGSPPMMLVSAGGNGMGIERGMGMGRGRSGSGSGSGMPSNLYAGGSTVNTNSNPPGLHPHPHGHAHPHGYSPYHLAARSHGHSHSNGSASSSNSGSTSPPATNHLSLSASVNNLNKAHNNNIHNSNNTASIPSPRSTPTLTRSSSHTGKSNTGNGSASPSSPATSGSIGTPSTAMGMQQLTPKASTRGRGKSIGKSASNNNNNNNGTPTTSASIHNDHSIIPSDADKINSRERERTITGKTSSSVGSGEESGRDYIGSMMDLDAPGGIGSGVFVDSGGDLAGGGGDVDMDAGLVGGGVEGEGVGIGMTTRSLKQARSTIKAGGAEKSKAPLSTSSISSSNAGTIKKPSSSTSSTVSRENDKERDSGIGRNRGLAVSGTATATTNNNPNVNNAALMDSNSIEANGVRVGSASVLVGGGTGEKEKGEKVARSGNKGKGRDYGDRFIPQRESSSDLASSYRLMPEHIAYSTGAGSGGIFGGDAVYLAGYNRSLAGGSLRRGMDGELDGLKDEANRAYSHLLQSELYGSSSATERPAPTHASSTPTVPSRPAHSGLAATPIVQGQYAGGPSVLPPLPSIAPTTPSSATASVFATTARGGPSSGSGVPRIYQPCYQPSNNNASGEPPSTPSRKRMFTFQSPQGSGRSSPNGATAAAVVSPGQFGLGQGIGTGVGMGLDDMLHEKYSLSPIGKESQRLLMSPRKSVRFISKTPFKVLDAPDLADDFYLNLVSWSNSNVLAVGLSACVYLWSAHTSKVTKLCDLGTGEVRPPSSTDVADTVTGLEWTNRGSTIAIGTNKGKVEIWDTEKCKKIRTMTGHSGRVGALAWNEHILSTGSRDRLIYHRDVRAPSQYIKELKGHRQEVCGLRWNTTTDQLASGGNDNKLYVWEKLSELPLYRFSEHCAAVKAITWSPHQRGILASGGGTADKKIRFWNTLTGTMLSEWDTGSQVCNLMWSKNSNELVSTHGYSGGAISNQICVWRYPTMAQVASLSGHTYRVLYLAMSPDGQTIVTGAGDETLRFWNAFQKRRTGEAAAIGMGLGEGAGGPIEIREESLLDPFSRIR